MIYDFTYQNPTRVHFGKNALHHLTEELAQYGARVLLIYGKAAIKKIGLYDQVIRILQKANKDVYELSGINANPRYSQLLEGVRLVREHQIDFILAVGGGSVIDCAKGISCGAYAEGDIWQRYYIYKEDVTNPIVPVGCILTMAGTGSEMNSGSVITNEAEHIKMGRVYPLEKTTPRFAILNPEYTYSVPRYQMVSGIADIFSHLMEQYFSGSDDCTTDYLIEGVMLSLISASRKAMINQEDYEARSNIMWCATMALNKLLSLSKTEDWEVHMIEHQLGAYTDCAHGIGLAVISPTYYRFIYRHGLHKFVRFAKHIWGVEDKGQGDDAIAREGIDRLESFFRELEIPATLRELGTTEAMLPLIAHSTVLGGGYCKLTANDVLTILKTCF
ncbi:MAG: iron-containing alcohol dehydrogenase [Paludibacter sp.]|nr:iron-containing alcohol dehydrogenase [Bacteroidales bacterium]MCM1068602.1 iron-containing alcohol dehydrogenase [Prevotella sp.]MCM1353266.1 iron-containing alcohol dehydrogenase [Bacteroides sp.]MCM1442326.1 iron-containing alcohol dehydrogenase [Muribaculum sp.]MCM1481145.1 iron-containing alcohol dehydrogenase [Paludibacter sp.]